MMGDGFFSLSAGRDLKTKIVRVFAFNDVFSIMVLIHTLCGLSDRVRWNSAPYDQCN